MEQQLNNIIQYKTIDKVTDEAINYIRDRKNHVIQPLKTRWKKFNKTLCGGIEPNMIYTIAGVSGSGKSAVANTLSNDLIDLNSSKNIIVLLFSFEMIGYRNIGRTISSKMKKTTTELYSADEDLSDKDFDKVEEIAQDIKKYPIYIVDIPSTVEKIGNTITYFKETIAKDKWLIVILDHTLLVNGENERSTIVDLQKMFIAKKKLELTSIIQISQMNRNIESSERINNPSGHYPMRSDLSSSDAIFQASDYVIAIHRPELYGIKAYGIKRLPVINKVYMHFLKIRDGEPKILEFENELKYGNLIETTFDKK